ncbi:hypothetical protein CWI42_121570 [Ordospora colligata]|uniref:Myb-like transcription factor n=1 Tax=Ordospora colligata OC4 TaxID=1354746 RepID=A0A0B2UI74_9MICR|nr:uncharacterized protein M896_121570 [Ordospora colligata OC4]KHN68934.1 hypothetical protein M896_121570 [Ordospora colligata OC4]TBU13968.1 hypothetical protein CWI40_121570 [Ordospora colligata]TBU14157.1 hypothetical protein CWI41_121570 [Ordospora colligata]TBU17826.1 hypothetical protein CWI42_121570 [Ordospora colligata]
MASFDRVIGTTESNGRLIKGPWRHEEDEKLVRLVSEYSAKNWSFIAKKLGSRVGKQCRERWHNHLNPHITKKPFSVEEEGLIIELHLKYGNRWSEIAKYLPGRTDNAIKNYWNSSIQRRSEKVRHGSMFCTIDDFHRSRRVEKKCVGGVIVSGNEGERAMKTKRSNSVQNVAGYIKCEAEDEDEFDEADELASRALLRICMSF